MQRTAVAFVLVLWPSLALGQTDVVTYHYDNARTGQNSHETTLTPANVASPQFRKLFSRTVDGDVYAQPLHVANLAIPGKGVHSVVFVATAADSVYALDAKDGSPLWNVSLIDTAHGAPAGATTVHAGLSWNPPPAPDLYCSNIAPHVGITSTPVIDRTTNTMYVDAKSKEGSVFVHRLHALDITTGAEKPSWPLVVAGSVNGVAFDAHYQNARAGLLLANGILSIGFGSHCDEGTYRGWIFAYDVATRVRKGIFLTTPHPGTLGAGIWMEAAGLAADASGNIFVSTGNGPYDQALANFGDSIVKLDPSLNVLDHFTPHDQALMAHPSCDLDLGSGAVVLLPDQTGSHPHLLVQAGKIGTVYLIDRDQMTANNQHHCANCGANTNIVQELPHALGASGVPAYWNGKIYFRGTKIAPLSCPGGWQGDDGVLRAFSLSGGTLTAGAKSTDSAYGSSVTISASGNSNGIVWAMRTDELGATPAQPKQDPVVLKAYDAVSLGILYSSDSNGLRDQAGGLLRFTTPMVADGRVYVGTAGQLDVFGLAQVTLPLPAKHVVVSPPNFPYKVTLEVVCVESIGPLCLREQIVSSCIGGNCFTLPKPAPGPTCVRCGLALSLALGLILGGIAAMLLARRPRP